MNIEQELRNCVVSHYIALVLVGYKENVCGRHRAQAGTNWGSCKTYETLLTEGFGQS